MENDILGQRGRPGARARAKAQRAQRKPTVLKLEPGLRP